MTEIRDFHAKNLDLTGKSIMITGGTGSFGQKCVRHILDNYKPARLIIFSRDELKQYEMAQRFSPTEFPCLRYFIGDVRDQERLMMATKGVDYIIHAAALKHVPIAEYNPMECIKTNVNGAENIVRAAIENGVEKIVALSTDKAANPINLYGASKLASDKIFVAANNLVGKASTRFCVVRYGNVVGSRGSVIPFFKSLVDQGAKTLPITDPRMTRFWITLDQGINFVMSSMEMTQGGEIFVPRIPSMKMTDMATALAPGLNHEIVGIRPGEKLHECMISSDDARKTIALYDRYAIMPDYPYGNLEKRQYKGYEQSPVNEDFSYSSDKNDEWLDADGLYSLIDDQKFTAA